jgi:predicted nucleic acid-binding protein
VRVFLDTNVWVSAFEARGVCEELLLRVLEDGSALTSPLVLKELTEVLTRKVLPSPAAWQRIRSLWCSAESVEDAPLSPRCSALTAPRCQTLYHPSPL